LQPKRDQALDDFRDAPLYFSFLVGIFNAQEEDPLALPGEQATDKRNIDRADMDKTGWAWPKACDDGVLRQDARWKAGIYIGRCNFELCLCT
jgi:hypothetical protein